MPSGVFQASDLMTARFTEIKEALSQVDRLQSRRLDLLAGLVVCDLMTLQPTLSSSVRSHAERAREILEDSLTEPISLKELAGHLFVSREYLRQLFRREFGESMMNYLIRRRVEFATSLLESTSDSVKEIAAQAGFPNEYYFSRVFRRVKGMPPSAWRRQKR